ncbi:MAG: HAD family hydrolase [Bacillota bacterium]
MAKLARQGIIFDFDDTLVETTVFFEIARERFARLMVEMGFPLEEVLAALDQKDIENVRRCGGFLKECFPRAMVQTYRHFCDLNRSTPDPDTCRQVEDIGWWVFDQKPVAVPGAGEILAELSARGEYDIFLATKGDPSIQWKRINDSGLKKYFKRVYVLKDKTRCQYEQIAHWQKLDAQRSWVIGNSIKSDINPGLLAGFNCIFIPNSYTWQYEMEEPLGEFVTAESLEKVLDLLLNKKVAV